MNNHYELNDLEFERKFEECSLEPKLFNHEAHLRLAWIYILKYGEQQAVKKVCNAIRRFDTVHGDGCKFHITVTVAAVKVVNHFMQKTSKIDFKGFLNEFPRLTTAFQELLGQHYGFDIFSDVKSKTEYVQPDLLHF
ncbi:MULTISPECIES: hypothetical protein [Flavobacteriaceae]|uniref:hypothetical protein n=1 Tax=Flavobacteriaceae TaxID=49546 RepID=UPI0014921758|nr:MULTISPECIES: hypothetical protein [Allomuricauda]MDC6364555.1 hypothetical protein [Muricauda sp. AC10]